LDILPPSNIPVAHAFTEPEWRRQYETLCRLGARLQPQVTDTAVLCYELCVLCCSVAFITTWILKQIK